MSEFENLKARRRMDPKRRARDLKRRVEAREYFVKYVPSPHRPGETNAMTREERFIIDYLKRLIAEGGERWVRYWDVLNDIGYAMLPVKFVGESRVERQKQIAIAQRMIKEKKLIRDRQRNAITLADWLMPDVSLHAQPMVLQTGDDAGYVGRG